MKRVALLCACLASASPAWCEDDSVTRRFFVAASELEKSGQIEPARKSYTQIVESAPESEWADDALLALARLEWSVDDPWHMLRRVAPLQAVAPRGGGTKNE